MQQMKNTVVSTMKDTAEKNQERTTSHLPPPKAPPLLSSPPISIHPPPPVDPPPSYPPSQRRSRSHHHHSGHSRPDKRPLSTRRSPRRQRSTRRAHRSSRPRSSSRRRRSTSRPPSRAASITLRSATPRYRDRQQRRRDDHELQEPTYPTTNLQPAKWDHYPQRPSHFPVAQSQSFHYDQHTTNKWKSWNQWKDYSKSSDTSNPSGWIDYSKPSASHRSKPLQSIHKTPHCILLRPQHHSSSLPTTSTLVRFYPISCIHPRSSGTCCHRSPFRIQTGLGPCRQICLGPS